MFNNGYLSSLFKFAPVYILYNEKRKHLNAMNYGETVTRSTTFK